MLHEGLGSVGLWGDFPDKLAAATGAAVFAYSRAGYGASTPVTLRRPLSYMHTEALEVLPQVLDAGWVLSVEQGEHGFGEGFGDRRDDAFDFTPAGEAVVGTELYKDAVAANGRLQAGQAD